MPLTGAAAYPAALVGRALHAVSLPATDGAMVDLSRLKGISVVYCYPRTSPPDAPPIPGWDAIPGARGCTPQSCGFRDLNAELQQAGADRVFGLSTQSTQYQQEMRTRLHLPFHILSDSELRFAKALGLATFAAGGMTLLRRMTMILRDGVILQVFDPADDPAGNASAVLKTLRAFPAA